jgi:hypothetical protein
LPREALELTKADRDRLYRAIERRRADREHADTRLRETLESLVERYSLRAVARALDMSHQGLADLMRRLSS